MKPAPQPSAAQCALGKTDKTDVCGGGDNRVRQWVARGNIQQNTDGTTSGLHLHLQTPHTVQLLCKRRKVRT